jgi:hypothetical protein
MRLQKTVRINASRTAWRGGVQTDLLTLDFTRIARHEAGLAQWGLSVAS